MQPITLALFSALVALSVLVLLLAIQMWRTESEGIRPGFRLAYICMVLSASACAIAIVVHESTRPLTDNELGAATWNAEEWAEVSPGTGIYRIPERRRYIARGRTLQHEEFPAILLRFLSQHPELEVVSTVQLHVSGRAPAGRRYVTVVTRPRGQSGN